VLGAYGQTNGPLELAQTIPLLGVDGRTDHLAVDLAGHRLFLCALGNNTLEVIDQIDRNTYKTSASIPTASGARTGLFVPEWNSLFVAVASGQNQKSELRRYAVE
jgi:hypothetical protein